MKAWLIQIDAWNGTVAVPVRMASHDDERLCNLDGQTWWPVIEKLPTLRYDFFDGSFDAASITSPSGSFDVAIEAIPGLPALAIHDARIRIWGGELGDAFAAFTLTFDGRVKEQPTGSDGSMSISIGADDSWLDQPLLKTYAGTGAAEGGTDLEGQVKQLALGAPRFAPATLVDAVDNIYQLSGYGPLQMVETAFERLNRFGAVAGNAGNFAGLKASEVKRGEWATCLAQGFVRFGAPPEGMLSFHVRGDAQGSWSRLPGDLCRRVAELAGGVAKVAAADVAALNVARPWPLSLMVTAQTTARDLIQRIAMSVNAVAYIDWLGMLRLAALGIGTASLTMAADGSALPPVAEVRQVETNPPYWKIAQGAATTWQVHGLNDIAFSAPLNPRGPYDPEETYREGDMVTLANGSQWLFIGTAPATGSAPADDNPNWFRLSDAITAANVTYDNGQTVEELKPAEPGATKGALPSEREQITQLEQDAATAQVNIAAAQAQIVALEGSVTADFTTLHQEVDGLQLLMTTAQGEIAALQSASSAVQGSVATLQQDVADAQSTIAAIDGQVSGLSNQIGTVSGDLATFKAQVGTINTSAGTLVAQIGTINTNIGSVTANVSALTTRVVDAEGDIDTVQATVATQGASITTAQTAITNIAGSLAEYQLRLSSNTRNLLPNGGPEALLRGWTSSAVWTVNNNNSDGAYFVFVPATTGTFALTSSAIPMEPNVVLTLSYETRNSGASSYCDIQCLDSSNNVLFDGPQNPGPSGTLWGDRAARASTITTPANTASVRVRIVTNVAATTDRARVRQIKLEKGPNWSAYSDDASIGLSFTAISTAETNLASLSTTVGTQGASITTAQTAITNLTGRTATLETTVSTQGGQISNLQSVTTTQAGTIAQHTTDIATANANISSSASAITTLQGSVSTLQSTVSTQGAAITANATAITTVQGSLAEYQLHVASNNRNLLANGGPEASLRGWTGSTTWTVNNNNSHGAYFLCAPTGAGSFVLSSGLIRMEGNAPLTLSYETQNTGAGAYCDILCFDSGGAQLLDGGQNAGSSGTSWGDRAQRAFTVTTPAQTANVMVRIVCDASSTSDRARVRQIKLERGTAWTGYSTETSVTQSFLAISTAETNLASLSTTVGAQGASIATAQTAITNLTGRTATLETTVSSQGASITSLQTATSTLTGNLASLTTRVSASGPNLLPNGGLENGFNTGIADPGGFSFFTGGWGPIAQTSANGLRVFQFSPVTGVQVGAQYTFAVDPLNLGTSDIYANIICLDGTGGVLLDAPPGGSGSAGDFSNDNVRRALMACTVMVPTGTASLLCRVYGTVRNNQPLGFRRAKLERGGTWTPYTAEASIVQTWTAVNTATGSIASLTTRVSTAEGTITQQATAITNLQGTTSSLSSAVSTQGGQISGLQSVTTTQAGTIAQHTSDIATANANISQNATAISTVSGNLASLSSTVSTQGASITSLQSTASTLTGNLATLTTRVNASQTNLLPNGGLENGFAGAIGTAAFALSIAAEWGPAASTTTNGQQVFQFAEITSVQPGATYWISCDPLAYGSSTIYCDLLFLNASGSVLLDGPQNVQTGEFNFSADDARRGLIAVSAVAPANTARIRARVVANVVSNAVAGFRRVKVETGPRWTPFSQEASVTSSWTALNTATSSLASLTTRVSTAEGSITTLQSSMTSANGSISTLQTNVSSLQGSVSTLQQSSTTQAGQISTLQSTVSTQGATITANSTAITSLQGNLATVTSVVTASSNPNLIVGFENGLTGWFGTSFNMSSGPWGAAVYRTVGFSGLLFLDSPATPAYAGQRYTAAADSSFYTSGTGSTRVEILFKDGAGNIVGNPQSASRYSAPSTDFSNEGSSRAILTASGLAPANTATAQIRLTAALTSGASSSIGWRQPKLEQGAVATPYSGEAAVIQTYSAYATLNSSFASLSTTVSSQGGAITTLQSSFTGLNGTVSSLSGTVSAQGASITSLQSASSTQSGLISTLQTQLVSGGGNLLQNTDFAVDMTGWNFLQVGAAHTGGRDMLGDNYRPLNEHVAGIYHSNNNGADYAYWQSQRVAIVPGKFYEFSVGAANSRANLTIYLRFLYGDGSVAADFTMGKSTFSEGNQLSAFPTMFARGQAPAGAYWVECLMLKSGTTPGNSDSYAWFVRPQLVEVPGLTGGPVAYSPGATNAVFTQQAQAISSANSQLSTLSTTVSTQGGSIATLQSSLTTLQGTVSTLSSTVSAQGASITSLQSTTATLQGNVATLTTRVSAASPNLLPNGGLENGFATGVGAAGNYVFGVSADWGALASTTQSGTQVFQFAPVTAYAGRTYTLACDPVCVGAGNTVYCDMLFRDANNNILLDSAQNIPPGPFDFDTTNGRRGQIAITATAPTGTTNVVCRFVGVVNSAGTIGFRQMKLERGSTWSPFSAEASITQAFSTLSTLSTQYASLSSTVSTQGVTISTQATAITTLNGNVATLFGKWGFEIDVNGLVSGMVQHNNGQRSSTIFRSDQFGVRPPGGTTDGYYIEFDGAGRTTQYIRSGNVRVVESGWLV